MRTSKGVTLIELIVTLSVAAILATTAVPSFITTIMNNRLSTQINRLVGALTLARSEAVKRKVEVTLCKTSNGGSCGGTGWEEGWVVFVDADDDHDIDSGEEILRIQGELSGNTTLRWNVDGSYLVYKPNGFSTNGTFILCDSRGPAKARKVVISNTGRPHIESGSSSCP